MSSSLQQVKEILKKIKEFSEPISGGSSEKGSFIMRKPELYWDLGLAVQMFCDEKKIPLPERKGWVIDYFQNIDESVWPGHQQSAFAYKYVYEFVDKETYLMVTDLAGNKFGNRFRRKRVDYLLTSFSKRNPKLDAKTQGILKKKLSERDYSHDEFLKVIQKVRGPTKFKILEISERFDELRTEVQKLIDADPEKRTEFRANLGLQLIDQIRFTLQLLRMRDPSKLKRAYNASMKSKLGKRSNSRSKSAISLFNSMKDCLGNEEKTNLLFESIDSYEMSFLNTLLRAMKSEENYNDYFKRRQALKEIFIDD